MPKRKEDIAGGAVSIFDAAKPDQPFPKKKSKFVPKGIDPAYPQKNFVKAHYENKGDMEGYYKYMYSEPAPKKASGFGHGVERRKGALRLSGNSKAHRIGKR